MRRRNRRREPLGPIRVISLACVRLPLVLPVEIEMEIEAEIERQAGAQAKFPPGLA